jgi:outer membrane biosynthesis protein TonB
VALVNEAGELVEPPTLTKSTGYLGLNQRALDAVQSYDFPEAESVKAYTFRVDVNYDSEQCLSLPSQAETG